MRIPKLLTVAAISLTLSCTTVGLFTINSGAKVIAEHDLVKNIEYGNSSWQKLDVYTPTKNENKQLLPVIIFFYGGSWDSGKKEDYLFAAEAFTSRGYVAVVADYVKYPQGKFPQFIQDGAKATAWVRDNIQTYSGNSEVIFIAGHSAGAHLGAMLVTDEQYLEAEGMSTSAIKGFAGLAGPYNFVPKQPSITRIFQPEENYPKMFVANFVTGSEPPMLLARGTADVTVGAFNQDILIERLKETGVEYTDKRYPDLTHVKILLGLAPKLRKDLTVLSDIDDFFRKQISNIEVASMKPRQSEY